MLYGCATSFITATPQGGSDLICHLIVFEGNRCIRYRSFAHPLAMLPEPLRGSLSSFMATLFMNITLLLNIEWSRIDHELFTNLFLRPSKNVRHIFKRSWDIILGPAQDRPLRSVNIPYSSSRRNNHATKTLFYCLMPQDNSLIGSDKAGIELNMDYTWITQGFYLK